MINNVVRINNNKINNIIKFILIILFATCISVFVRTNQPEVFTFYGNDGSVQGLSAIFYVIFVLPTNIALTIGYIHIILNNKANILHFIITILLNIIMLYINYLNICLLIYDFIYVAYNIYNIKVGTTKKINNSCPIIIIAILILIFLPANPQRYEEYAAKNVKNTIEEEILKVYEENYYVEYIIHQKNNNYISYEIKENNGYMGKKVEANIKYGQIVKAIIKYKNITYEYKDTTYKMYYKTKFKSITSTILKKAYKNLFRT